jgi:Fe-S oxidoreductase
VALNDANRGGVMGMGSVLTLTSYPRRTSPVQRGKWVLEEILGAPPPPPPPSAGVLPQDDAPKDGLTFRQRMEKHREKAECANCHARMDPIGFGLENFDPTGKWRTEISKTPVDATGVMSTGEKFNGPKELRKILFNKKDEFARVATEKMLSYALGRGLEYYDQPTVRGTVKALKQNNYSAQRLVVEIVNSYPFLHRRGGLSDVAGGKHP